MCQNPIFNRNPPPPPSTTTTTPKKEEKRITKSDFQCVHLREYFRSRSFLANRQIRKRISFFKFVQIFFFFFGRAYVRLVGTSGWPCSGGTAVMPDRTMDWPAGRRSKDCRREGESIGTSGMVQTPLRPPRMLGGKWTVDTSDRGYSVLDPIFVRMCVCVWACAFFHPSFALSRCIKCCCVVAYWICI